MRKIDDAKIEARLVEIANAYNGKAAQVEVLRAQLKEAESELNRLQGDYRTWASFKGIEAEIPAAEVEN